MSRTEEHHAYEIVDRLTDRHVHMAACTCRGGGFCGGETYLLRQSLIKSLTDEPYGHRSRTIQGWLADRELHAIQWQQYAIEVLQWGDLLRY